MDYRVPVEIGAVRVDPGDFIFADLDGVVVVPRRAEKDVFAAAFEKVREEKRVRSALEGGMSAAEAFHKFGVL
jgi:regulator of RNase E activity RraA